MTKTGKLAAAAVVSMAVMLLSPGGEISAAQSQDMLFFPSFAVKDMEDGGEELKIVRIDGEVKLRSALGDLISKIFS